MKPIQVLHVVSVDKENYYLNNLADHSDPSAVEHSFITLAAEDADFVRDMRGRGRKVIALNCVGRAGYPRAYRSIRRFLKNQQPDVVHTHLFDPSLIGLTVAKRNGFRTVCTRHHSDALHAIASPIKRCFYLGLEARISKLSDHIIAPSTTVRDILVDTEGVAAEKVTVIPYGQTTERFDAITPDQVDEVRQELTMGRDLALVCVSRLFHRKGHVFLFEAFAELIKEGPGATLYLVGDGEYRETLEGLTRRLGIADRVVFLGWRGDALAIVAAADIVVHPSLEDALSSAVIEAVMLEKPVVATDISGVRDSLGDGRYGRIVPPADAEQFREGMREVISNLDRARQRAREGKKYLLKYMDAKNVADQHLSIYQDLSNK